MFITFEGIEGSGKTTLMRGVAQALRAGGRDVVETREPGGTPTGDRIRAIFLESGLQIAPLAEALLLNASRVHLMAEVIEPALRAGSVVLCDRFTDSTLAYQGYARGLDLSMLRQLGDAATDGRTSDLTFFVDIPVALSRDRVAQRQRDSGGSPDRLDRENDAFHERVRAGYLALAAANPRRIVVLHGYLPADRLVSKALEEMRVLSK
jgi:dTMP kinase